jgi:hypothetical protein
VRVEIVLKDVLPARHLVDFVKTRPSGAAAGLKQVGRYQIAAFPVPGAHLFIVPVVIKAAPGMGELLFCYGGFPGLAGPGYKAHLPAEFFGEGDMIQVAFNSHVDSFAYTCNLVNTNLHAYVY